jgi:hypothetical protein
METIKLINLTPHSIGLYVDGKEVLNLKSEGQVRLEEHDEATSGLDIEGVGKFPLVVRSYGSGTLPEEKEGTGYIVSQIVCAAFPERSDLFWPAADVRDDQGRIIGTTTLCQVPLPQPS